MMALVSRRDIRQSSHRDLFFVGDAPATPGLLVKTAEQRQGGSAHTGVLVEQIGDTALAEVTVAHVIVLLESFDRSLISAPDPQGAIGEDPLGIGDMSENFFDRPFAWAVSEIRLLIVQSGKHVASAAGLLLERGEDVSSGDQ